MRLGYRFAAHGPALAVSRGASSANGYTFVPGHPDGVPGDRRGAARPEIVFYANVPAAGSYRLFPDLQDAGVVRPAEITVATTEHQEGPHL